MESRLKRNICLREVRGNIVDIFGKSNLETAFICGSVASEKDTPKSDIDIFVCSRDYVSEKNRNEFTDYYIDLHEQAGRQPDVTSPGELMSLEQLEYGLDKVTTIEPTLNLRNRYNYDYLCWAGMLIGKKENIIEMSPVGTYLEGVAMSGLRKWISHLRQDMSGDYTYQTGEETDLDKVLAQIVSCKGYYDIHE